jgi:hypothetical protein
MPRVVPSQIVEFVDAQFPHAGLPQQQFVVGVQFKGSVSAILRLVNELPNELLMLDSGEYNRFVLSVSTIESTLGLESWNTKVHPAAQVEGQKLGEAITDLRACLEVLPDEQVPAATAGLPFITDVQLRESIRGDIAFANQAFNGGEWKAATVLAGAAAEALLHWAITRKKPSDVEGARAAVNSSASKNLDVWNLDVYIKVAKHLALIEDETGKQADLAREFRNLIHPGRAARLAKVCGRGTALSALAAVEFIVRDLS